VDELGEDSPFFESLGGIYIAVRARLRLGCPVISLDALVRKQSSASPHAESFKTMLLLKTSTPEFPT
jgi:hypothetical protein